MESNISTHSLGPPPAAVGILLLHSQLNLYIAMGKKLARRGCKVIYYTRSEKERGAVLRLTDSAREDVIVSDLILILASEPLGDPKEIVSRARDVEARIGEPLNKVGLTHRHLGWGYSPGSFNYPRDPELTGIGYWNYLNAVLGQIEFWEEEIRRHGLELLVDAGKEAAVACRAANISYRWMIYARYKDHRAWSVDEYQSIPGVRNFYEKDAEADLLEPTLQPYIAGAEKNEIFWRRHQIGYVVSSIIRNCTLRLGGQVYRRDWSRIRFHHLVLSPIRVYREARKIKRLSTETAVSLADTPFVYMPLQKEPEQALLMTAPDHTDQLAIAIEVSRSLPAGVMLVISEHPFGIGRRPDNFYDQLAALPNVRFFSFSEPALAKVAASSATVSISGTAVFEAAILGRPAVVYNRRSVPEFLDHVFVANRDGALEEIFSRIIRGKIDMEKARKDGARFERALRDASFSLGKYGTTTTEAGYAPPDELVTRLTQRLLAGLPIGETTTGKGTAS